METYANLFLNSVIPVMQNNFLRHSSQEIIVLRDNTSLHSLADDDEIPAALNETVTMRIVFYPQSAKNLRWCISDLFSSTQSLQNKINTTNIDNLVGAVAVAFQETGSVALDRV